MVTELEGLMFMFINVKRDEGMKMKMFESWK